MAYEIKTFEDIYTAVQEELGVQASDTITLNRIKRDINAVYINEIVPYNRWWWLRRIADITHPAKYNTGSASVVQYSRNITLSTSPADSYKGAWFNLKGELDRYRIAQHVAGSDLLVIESDYNGPTSSTKNFILWRDGVPLPANAKEVVEVVQDHLNVPVENKGLQEMRRLIATGPIVESRPRFYSTGDFVDPDPYSAVTGLPAVGTVSSEGYLKTIKFAATLGASAGSTLIKAGDNINVGSAVNATYNIDDAIVISVTTTTNTYDTIKYVGSGLRTETNQTDATLTVEKRNQGLQGKRYRELLVYPSVFDKPTTLHVDYIEDIRPMENDDDEPLIPIEDRIILVYGTLSRSWVKQRNPEMAGANKAMYDAKLARMHGKTEDSPDKPQIKPSQQYLNRLRHSSRVRNLGDGAWNGSFGGSGGGSTPLGTSDTVAIFDDTGRLTASPEISTTELNYLDGATSNIQDQIDALGIASPVGNRAVITNGSGGLAESSVTSTELLTLVNDEPLTTFTLTDNTAVPSVVEQWAVANFTKITIDYSLKRATDVRGGTINIVSDGSNAYIAEGGVAESTSAGVVFTTDVSAGSLRLLFTTTATGSDATMRSKVSKWLI